MEYECIRYEARPPSAVITLYRPRVLNAMNKRMWMEIDAALAAAKADESIRVVIFTGEGRAFSTGADLKESRTRSLEDYRDYLSELQEVSRRIIRYPKPTIAAINGYAVGSGYELALACDLRIAAEDAQIGSPEAKVTSSVTGGAFRLLQDLVGPGKARELLFTGDYIDGREAFRIGLVNRAVPAEELMETAFEMARKIAANSAFSLSIIKKGLLMAAGEAGLEALMDFEIEGCLACVSTKERRDSLEQFADRKQPPSSS
jgi:enoyl-CoA hydratase